MWSHLETIFLLLKSFKYNSKNYSLVIVHEFLKWYTTIFIIFLDILIFHQISLSLQVKRNAIISNKHNIYELPYELSNDLRLRILRNWERSGNFKTI